MDFVDLPVGPLVGLDEIAASYRESPPDDTLEVRAVRTQGAVDVVQFEWTRGGGGAMTLLWSPDGLVQLLTVGFADPGQAATSSSTDG